MSDLKKGGRIVNRADLATLCNVTLPTVDAWVRRGCPAVERGSKGREWQFDFAEVVQWRIDRAVADAVAAHGGDGAGMSKEEADRRKAVAQAHMAEVELEDRLANTISRTEALGMFADFCLALKTGMSNGLDKIAARGTTITSSHELRTMGEAEWNRAMALAREEFSRLWETRFPKDVRKIDGPAEAEAS